MSLHHTSTPTQEPVIAVFFNNGENAQEPWHVGLKVGRAIDAQFGRFRNPLDAITYALDVVSSREGLPVIWPEWLKVVLPEPVAVSWNSAEVI